MSAPTIKQLSPDDRPWRIDWFGDISYPNGATQRSQPSVTISISPLACDPADREALLSPGATLHHQQQCRKIAIGMLPCIRVGDIWQHGQCVHEPGYQEETFLKLEIERVQGDKELVNIIKSGLPIDGSYLLPLDEHPWHRRQTHSYCVCVALPGNKRLIVPCLELIRFYFGSSSGLLHKLFTGPLTEDVLWEHKNYDPSHGELYLKLAEGISGYAAEDTGRIANCREAWKSARMIYDSCLSASIQSLAIHPYTTFPFEGETDLAASGKWLSYQGVPNSTFVVYRLRSCNHPFPFRELRYEVSDRVRIEKPKKSSDPQASNASSARTSSTKHTGSILDGKDPGTAKRPKNLRIGRSMKFPDLVGKFIQRVKYETADRPEVMRLNQDGGIEKVSTGAGTSSGEARQVELVQTPREATPAGKDKLPSFVFDGISIALRQIGVDEKAATWIPVTLPGYTDPVISLPVLVDEDGVIDEIVLRFADGTVRQRRACFVKISHEDQSVVNAFIVEASARHLKVQVVITDETDLIKGMNALMAQPSAD